MQVPMAVADMVCQDIPVSYFDYENTTSPRMAVSTRHRALLRTELGCRTRWTARWRSWPCASRWSAPSALRSPTPAAKR